VNKTSCVRNNIAGSKETDILKPSTSSGDYSRRPKKKNFLSVASKSGSVIKHAGNNYYCALKKLYSENRHLTKQCVVIISSDCSLFSLLC